MTQTSNPVDFLHPTKSCDLVMKGGLTSGIVYPAAVLKLAEQYKFKCIGGTSAGAIAAAVTAAAEAGRDTGGFEKLQKVAAEIAEPGFLLKIFRASGPPRSLMDLLVSVLALRPKGTGKSLRKVWFFSLALYARLLRYIPGGFLIGAVIGMVLFGASAYLMAFFGHMLSEWYRGRPPTALHYSPTLQGAVAITALFGFIVGSIAGPSVKIVYLLLRYLPRRNFFGICSGFTKDDPMVLTNWIHRKINDLFDGRDENADAITFADLEKAGVSLKAISTNLAQNRPYIFPREPEGFRLVFDEAKLARLFPPAVMNVLTRASAALYRGPKLPKGYHYLPERSDLPVVVATRMSLSFPVLISAVPLHEVKPQSYAAKRQEAVTAGKQESEMEFGHGDLIDHWFSDGGICSNFPIGLFDAWLPGHPTFGINLNYLKSGEKRCVGDRIGKVPMEKVPGPDSDHASESWQDDVYLPPVTDHLRPQWTSITEMFSFLGAIFNSAQNYHDTLQSMLPSYSERIVQVWLDPDEGGMNLAMDANKIRSLIDKGELAGSKLAGMDFDAHRCMRLRVLLKVLCVEIEDLHARYPTLAEYEAIAKAPGTRCSEPDQTFWADVKPYVDSLAMFAAAWSTGKPCNGPFQKFPPKFEGNLHIHPKV